MTYLCELAEGQSLYLDNPGTQTVLTLTSSSPGQQQQSSSSVQTGQLTAPPEVFRTAQGIVIRLITAEGDRLIHLQGNRISPLDHSPDLSSAERIQVKQPTDKPSMPLMESMQPMQPMQPMNLKMGDMQMTMNPMQIRMGDMELKMGTTAASASEPASKTAQTQRFCSQCGVSVDRSDRFCSNCGHQLSVKV